MPTTITARERATLFLLASLPEPGDSVFAQFIREEGATDALTHLMGTHDLATAANSAMLKRLRPRLRREWSIDWAIAELVRLENQWDTHFIVPGDVSWPNGLADLGDHAPIGLWVRGDLQALASLNDTTSVSMVGARAATSYGEHVAREIASELAMNGYITVSGAAYGIDGAVHRASLAVGGRTIAFIAGGVDRPYPAGHAHLIGTQIPVHGCVVSEIPIGSSPTKWRFLQRNRLIAAATPGTVVVEAGFRSGSLNTAGHASSLGRVLMAVPGPITSPASAGTHRLIREFSAVCITGADDVREALAKV